MCSLLRTIFYYIKVIPLTTLAAMRIGPRDLITHSKPCNGYNFSPCLSAIFDNFTNIHEYAN